MADAKKRGRPRHPAPEAWKLGVIRLIGEQQALRLDQLGRFLGAGDLSAERVAEQLWRDGLGKCERIIYAEGPWVWLTYRGMRFTGLGLHGEDPRIGALKKIRALNEVRLHITSRAPQARWICGRVVKQELGTRGHQPAAVVEVGAERHAIVVAPGRTLYENAASAVWTHAARYDAVVYFCDPAPRRALQRLKAKHHWPKLVVRAIPLAPGEKSSAIGEEDREAELVVLSSSAENPEVAEKCGSNRVSATSGLHERAESSRTA